MATIVSVSKRKPKKLKGKSFKWVHNPRINRWVKIKL